MKATFAERSLFQPSASLLTPDSPFPDLVAYWLEDLDLEGRVSPRTRDVYAWNMNKLVLPAFAALTLRDIWLAAQEMKAVSRSEPVVTPEPRRVATAAPERHRTLEAVIREFARAEIESDDVALRQPSLDDVFMSLTGKNGGKP